VDTLLGLGKQLGLTVVSNSVGGTLALCAAARLRLSSSAIRSLNAVEFVRAGRDSSMEVDIEGLVFDYEEWRTVLSCNLKSDDAWAVVAIGGHDIPVLSWSLKVFFDAGVSVARAEFDMGDSAFYFESRPVSFFVTSRDVYEELLKLGCGVREEYEDGMGAVFLVP